MYFNKTRAIHIKNNNYKDNYNDNNMSIHTDER